MDNQSGGGFGGFGQPPSDNFGQQPGGFGQPPGDGSFGQPPSDNFGQQPGGFGQTPMNASSNPDKPNFKLWIILCGIETLLCCLPIGLIGLLVGVSAQKKWEQKLFDESRGKLKIAKIMFIVGLILWLILAPLVICYQIYYVKQQVETTQGQMMDQLNKINQQFPQGFPQQPFPQQPIQNPQGFPQPVPQPPVQNP